MGFKTQPSTNRTLGSLRNSMALRLGFGSQGSASLILKPVLNEYLQGAQTLLHEMFGSMLLHDYVDDREMQAGQTLYDIVPQADPQRIDEVAIYIGGQWSELHEGIRLYNRDDVRGVPNRYMVKYGTTDTTQLEISPIPQDDYKYGYTFIRKLNRFVQDEDECTINANLVFLLALSEAMEHYEISGAEAKANQVNRLMGQLRARKNTGIKVRRGTPGSPARRELTEFYETVNQINYERNVLNSEFGQYIIPE